MDDPHLVAVENRLQDLLDAVTVVNGRCVSEGGLGGGGVQEWGAVWHWGRREAENQDGACHTGEETPARRGPHWPAQGRATPCTPQPAFSSDQAHGSHTQRTHLRSRDTLPRLMPNRARPCARCPLRGGQGTAEEGGAPARAPLCSGAGPVLQPVPQVLEQEGFRFTGPERPHWLPSSGAAQWSW